MAFYCYRRYKIRENWRKIPPDLSSVDHSVKTVPFRNNLDFAGDSVCTIDLVGFKEGEAVIVLPNCRHIFHPICISEWLHSPISSKRCPNCNAELGGLSINLNS